VNEAARRERPSYDRLSRRFALMLPRLPLAVLVVAASFGAGLASSRLLERDAFARAAPLASTIYVPSDGLAFRTFDGRVIARLSYGRHGGVFDLYDTDERPTVSVRADGLPGQRSMRPYNPLDMDIQ
jgi:hypothetical protein